jgi:hypothetical protein
MPHHPLRVMTALSLDGRAMASGQPGAGCRHMDEDDTRKLEVLAIPTSPTQRIEAQPKRGSMVMASTEQVKEAAEVYIYGYPLVYDLQEVANFVSAEDKSLPIHAPTTRSPLPAP